MSLPLRFDAKQPGDLDSFTFDFVRWLTPGDAIASASVSTAPAAGGVTDMLVVGQPAISGTEVSAWLQGGTSGTDYIVSYHIQTTLGRNVIRSAHLYCGPR